MKNAKDKAMILVRNIFQWVQPGHHASFEPKGRSAQLKRRLDTFLPLALLILLSCATNTAFAREAAVPAGIDHQPWDQLLSRYVDADGLVDYQGWKDSELDLQALDTYVEQFADASAGAASGDEEVASLINAYNAFTIQFVLSNYPTESIRLLGNEFSGRRHLIGGQKMSVEDIELDMLRSRVGWKMHSVLVCAARGCPPLLDHAYFTDDWEDKMEERYRFWLAREDLNQYMPARRRVEISKIFDWHKVDFNGDGKPSVAETLARFGPEQRRAFLRSESYKVRYRKYGWGLNDQSELGKDYRHRWSRWLRGRN